MKQPENNEQDGNSKFYLSRIALNVSGLNYPIKGHRITENVKKKKKDTNTSCLQNIHFS